MEKFNTGFLNDIWTLKNFDASKPDYLIQRINSNRYENPMLLTQNIDTALDYLFPEEEYQVILPIKTKRREYAYRDAEGFFWRVFRMISRKERVQFSDLPTISFAWANSFGKFLQKMDEYPVSCRSELKLKELYSKQVMNVRAEVLRSSRREKPIRLDQSIDFVIHLLEQVVQLNNIYKEMVLINQVVAQAAAPKKAQEKLLNLRPEYSKCSPKTNKKLALA